MVEGYARASYALAHTGRNTPVIIKKPYTFRGLYLYTWAVIVHVSGGILGTQPTR